MPLEVLQDILDELADKMGVYGAHDDENDAACNDKPCRVCWTSYYAERIGAAVRLEETLERGRKRG